MLKSAALALALSISAQAVELTPIACAPQTYTPEALRYEMEGSVQVAFSLGQNGEPVEPKVLQTSAYSLLNRDALAHARTCRFAVTEPAGTLHTMTVKWQLPQGRPQIAPQFLPQTCLHKYKVLTPAKPGAEQDSLTVRMQIWSDGSAYTPKVEHSSNDPDLDKLAEHYVENCRFEPALRDGKPVQSATLLTLSVDRAVYSEAKMRGLYDRLAARMAQNKDVKVAHILYASEAAALEAIAALRNGQAFGQLAKQQSLDKASGKVDGELGWVRPSDMVASFSAALQAQEQPGLIAKPVHTQFGWHVVQVWDFRPASVPPYEAVSDHLRLALLKETETVVQSPPATASGSKTNALAK